MKQHPHVDLMQLYDEELPPERIAELEAELSEQDQAVIDGLDQLSEVVRMWGSERGAEGASIADDVMARLDEERLASEPTPPPAATHRWGVVAAALAMAAAAALALNLARAPKPEAARAPVVAPSPAPVEAASAPSAVAESEGSTPAAIESIDFGSQNGAIFMVPAGTETTPVVWLTDDAAEGGDRMEPL